MRKEVRGCLLIALLGSLFTGCGGVMPVHKKGEMLNRLSSDVIKKANYLKLAHYWDNNYERPVLGLFSNGNIHLRVFEKDNKAEIVLGNGTYYGMMELVGVDERTTKIKVYSWGFGGWSQLDESFFDEWKRVINEVPDEY